MKLSARSYERKAYAPIASTVSPPSTATGNVPKASHLSPTPANIYAKLVHADRNTPPPPLVGTH